MAKNKLYYKLKAIMKGENLTIEESFSVAMTLIMGKPSPIHAALLTALTIKGETDKEIAGFAQAIRKYMITITSEKDTIDVCGTGGDGKRTFNISTAVSFVVAACDISVAKHGNRAITSNCGSADVLEELGVNIYLTPKKAEDILNRTGLTFLFAPEYHPVLKSIAKLRRNLGFRTIFNILGPLVNPAKVKYQLIGTPTVEIAKKIANTLIYLGTKRAFIVSSRDGTDEITLTGKSLVFVVNNGKIRKKIVDPSDYGFSFAPPEKIRGGNKIENARIIRLILSGKDKGLKRDTVLLNSALAITLVRDVSIKQALRQADNAIRSGRSYSLLEQFIKLSREKDD